MEKKKIQQWKEFSGRLQAVDYVEIRPEVSGRLQDVRFKDGERVEKEDILFVIDPAPYAAAVEKAEADFQVAKSQHELARKNLERANDLVKTEAISKKIFDERKSESLVSKSVMDSAQAQLTNAKINLDRAYVKAPISGRISRAEITVGNLVQSSNPPVLTTIVSDQGIYADFDVDEQTYLSKIYRGARDSESQAKIPVEMILKSEAGRSYSGVIESFDNQIDPKSGTIRVRAMFDNHDQSLLPGMFVSVRLGGSMDDDVMMIPERVIGTDQDRKFVYVVGEGHKVVYREIKTGSSMNGQRVVLDGLKVGDVVITEGIMKVRPDMIVTPKPEKDTKVDSTAR
ncbi:MAG: efflux RND transporter periplasmic adaptor subunit [Alphaproteobacteria bacterium]|nr:efflux RND transporter periplasmic adaptor subunit [Alphaproteobacteria bacterium]